MSYFSIELTNWRAFRDKVSMTVKPLTLIYGHNQAGKSSLLRALPLLADSIYGNAGPLNTNSAAMSGSALSDLGWKRKGYPTWGVRLHQEQKNLTVSVSLANEDDRLIVNRFELYEQQSTKQKRNEFLVTWEKTKSFSQSGGLVAEFEGIHKGQAWRNTLSFEHLFPTGLPSESDEQIALIKRSLEPLSNIQWLQANRVFESPFAANRPRNIRCCAEDGSNLAALMQPTGFKDVLRLAADWCSQQNTITDDLWVRQDANGVVQFYLQRQDFAELPLYLAGEGVRSLLPMIICASWADLSRKQSNLPMLGPSMLAIEEPESHLHPHWQVAVFDRLLESVKLGTPVVLETHSVHILRAMQLAVLEGRISPSEIALYWVDQTPEGVAKIESITVEPDASLTGWRPDVFETEQELAHKILDRRWQNIGGQS